MKTDKATKIIDEALSSLADAVENGHSQTLKLYLEKMALFHQYSFHNTMLIASQFPSATHVAGYHAWKKFGRYVRKGQKGIAIIAPFINRIDAKEDSEPQPYTHQITGYGVVYVFDVSQTAGEELPAPAQVQGNPSEYIPQLDKLISDSGITLQYSDATPSEGLSQGGRIVIRSGLKPAHEFSVKVHELAHELLHHSIKKPDKTQIETEAEAIAFVVCNFLGLDTNTAASDYIQSWDGNRETLLNSFQRIKETSSRIIAGLG